MWRTEHYKLILSLNRKENANDYSKSDIIGGEFYNLNKDPQEWNNLYDAQESEVHQNKMSNALMGHLSNLGRISSKSIKL